MCLVGGGAQWFDVQYLELSVLKLLEQNNNFLEQCTPLWAELTSFFAQEFLKLNFYQLLTNFQVISSLYVSNKYLFYSRQGFQKFKSLSLYLYQI